MRRVSWTNVLAVLLALYVGAHCAASGQEITDSVAPARDPNDTTYVPSLVFRDMHPIVPGPIIRGVWYATQGCLYNWSLSPDSIRWAQARYIVDVQRRRLIYGVNSVVRWSDGPHLTIVLDRLVRYNVQVISHESTHAMEDVPDGDWHLDACTIVDGPYLLPPRPLSSDQIQQLLTY